MPALLEIEGLEVRYGPVAAIRDVSFEVGEGEIVGLVPAARGAVRLGGRSLLGRPPEEIARAGVALVPEGRRIFGELSVEENLRLGMAGRRSREGAGRDLDAVLGIFPMIEEARRRQAGVLSGGQQQQLAIARALVSRPDVLLLDEPSLGLAPTVVDVVFDALAEIRESGVTILLVEQRAQRTVAFADRTHVLSNGQLRLTLGPEDASDTRTMVAAYFS